MARETVIADLKTPSTRIRIFWNPQLFLSGFKNFHVHTLIRIQIEFARPHVFDTYPDSLSYPGFRWEYWQQNMRRKAHEVCTLICLVSFSVGVDGSSVDPNPVAYLFVPFTNYGPVAYFFEQSFAVNVPHSLLRFLQTCEL